MALDLEKKTSGIELKVNSNKIKVHRLTSHHTLPISIVAMLITFRYSKGARKSET